jgi:hypothetical protein
MSLLPDNATFHEQVEACFVAYRGRGVSLSAVDLELVDGWAALEVPVEVIARGIRRAAEAALFDAPEGQGQLRSLKAARRAVDAEVQKFLKRAQGRTEAPDAEPVEPFHLARRRRLAQALKKLAKEQPSVSTIAVRVAALPAPTDFVHANRQEELALALLLRGLPTAERRSILREARRLVENANPASAAVRRESLRFHRAALVRHRWAIPAFW